MKRRLLSISLALALCLTLLPTAAWAAGDEFDSDVGGGTASGGTVGGDISGPGGGSGDAPSSGSANVEDWEQLLEAIEAGKTYINLSYGITRDPEDTEQTALTISGEKDLTIDLNGHTLDTDGSEITVSDGATLTIENDPDEPEPGTITGGIQVEADGTLIITQGEASDGATEPGVTITGNTAPDGGGIYAAGTVTIGGNAKITGNSASKGGIYVADGGNVTIQANVEITGNEATGTGDNGLGGGVYNAGTFTMDGGAIYGNSAENAAADFYNAPGGTFTLPQAKEGYAWYEDKPDERYTGTQTPCTNPETGLTGENEIYLAAEVPLDGDGSEGNPYLISSPEKLAAFRDIVNGSNGGEGNPSACAKLMDNINLGGPENPWTPIGPNFRDSYSGTFDGQGHTISDLYCTVSGVSGSLTVAGLFHTVGAGGTVRNLNVEGSVSASGGSIIAGGICGSNSGTITGCTFHGSVSGSDASAVTVGGVCGTNDGAVENCWNAGKVTVGNATSLKAGGVCGMNQGTVENCWNDGSVTAKDGVASLTAGGVCGQNYRTVENCLNTGAVTTSGSSTYNYAGGVCGYNQSSVNENSGIVENCLNTGEVTTSGSSTYNYAGGVCGSNYGTVTHCYWLNTACDNGIGSSDDQQKATPKTSEQLASGEVAYLLNTDNNTKPWRQNLDNVEEAEKDPIPVLDALDDGHGAVYPIKNEESGEIARYSNYPGGKRTISGCTVTLSTNTFTYNGKVQKPEVTVVWEENTPLTEGIDYTVTFSGNCIDADDYTITIEGIGQYTGTATATYTIKAAETGGETGGNTGGSSSSGGSHRPARDDGPSTGASDGWKDIRDEI